jgi:hypothetical protein
MRKEGASLHHHRCCLLQAETDRRGSRCGFPDDAFTSGHGTTHLEVPSDQLVAADCEKKVLLLQVKEGRHLAELFSFT